ncbi:TIGR01777 family oxidoreductase [Planctomycetota bacterium]
MNILVTGASGLVGTALMDALQQQGHSCFALRRNAALGTALQWDPTQGSIDLGEAAVFDVVFHLAGESIAQGRWTAAKKARLRDSRVLGTKLLAETLAKLDPKPSVLISASAIGFYGERGDLAIDETAEPGTGFLAELCQAWEAATKPAQYWGIRVVHARLGVVLSPRGGALKSMLLPFKLGLGGRVGSGTQYMSWVSLTDVVAVLRFLMNEKSMSGPVNVVAPTPVTNQQFTQVLGRALRRPTFMPMPAFAARLAFGELADALLLASTRVTPSKLMEAGYTFKHSHLEQAFAALL